MDGDAVSKSRQISFSAVILGLRVAPGPSDSNSFQLVNEAAQPHRTNAYFGSLRRFCAPPGPWGTNQAHVLNAPPSPVFCVRGGRDAFQSGFYHRRSPRRLGWSRKRRPCAILSNAGLPPGSGIFATAQQPVWYGEGEGDPNSDVGRTGRPELANTGRDAGITSSTRGETADFLASPRKSGRRRALRRSFPASSVALWLIITRRNPPERLSWIHRTRTSI